MRRHSQKPKIKVTGQGRFAIKTSYLAPWVEYQFVSHGPECSVFAVVVKHLEAIKFCPICGSETPFVPNLDMPDNDKKIILM